MTMEEVLSDADSDDEQDEEFKDLLERLVFHCSCFKKKKNSLNCYKRAYSLHQRHFVFFFFFLNFTEA